MPQRKNTRPQITSAYCSTPTEMLPNVFDGRLHLTDLGVDVDERRKVCVGVVGETISDEETNAAEIEVASFEAVVKPGLSTSTGCMFEVGRR